MDVTAVWLRTIGNRSEVLLEIDKQWYKVIEEPHDAPYSHCVHIGGIERCLLEGPIKEDQ